MIMVHVVTNRHCVHMIRMPARLGCCGPLSGDIGKPSVAVKDDSGCSEYIHQEHMEKLTAP